MSDRLRAAIDAFKHPHSETYTQLRKQIAALEGELTEVKKKLENQTVLSSALLQTVETEKEAREKAERERKVIGQQLIAHCKERGKAEQRAREADEHIQAIGEAANVKAIPYNNGAGSGWYHRIPVAEIAHLRAELEEYKTENL